MFLPFTNEATTTKSAKNIVNLKVRDNEKKLQPTVDYMLDPHIDLNYNSSYTELEQFAVGQVLQIVNIGGNKMCSTKVLKLSWKTTTQVSLV